MGRGDTMTDYQVSFITLSCIMLFAIAVGCVAGAVVNHMIKGANKCKRRLTN